MDPQAPSERCVLQTRVPAAMRRYLKAYARQHRLQLDALATEVLTHFIALRPDQRGLRWRTPHSTRSERGSAEQWVQINLIVPNALAAQVVGLSMRSNQSTSQVLYTALYWWVRYLCPPAREPVVSAQRASPITPGAPERMATNPRDDDALREPTQQHRMATLP